VNKEKEIVIAEEIKKERGRDVVLHLIKEDSESKIIIQIMTEESDSHTQQSAHLSIVKLFILDSQKKITPSVLDN